MLEIDQTRPDAVGTASARATKAGGLVAREEG